MDPSQAEGGTEQAPVASLEVLGTRDSPEGTCEFWLSSGLAHARVADVLHSAF